MAEENGERHKENRKYNDPWLESLRGKSITVVERNATILTGTLADYGFMRLRLENVKIQGKRTVNVPWVIIERPVVAHQHPTPEVVEEPATQESHTERGE